MSGVLLGLGQAAFTGLAMWAAYRAQEDQRRNQISMLNAQTAQAMEEIKSLEAARTALSEIYRTKRGFVEITFKDRYAGEGFQYGRSARALTRKSLAGQPGSIRYRQYDPLSDEIASRMEIDQGYDLTKRFLRTQKATSLFDLEAQQARESSSIESQILAARHRMNLYGLQLSELRG